MDKWNLSVGGYSENWATCSEILLSQGDHRQKSDFTKIALITI